MDADKLQYWNNRIIDKFKVANKAVIPALNEVSDMAIHIDEKSKEELKQKVDAVHTAMRDLAETVDKVISKKARNLILNAE